VKSEKRRFFADCGVTLWDVLCHPERSEGSRILIVF